MNNKTYGTIMVVCIITIIICACAYEQKQLELNIIELNTTPEEQPLEENLTEIITEIENDYEYILVNNTEVNDTENNTIRVTGTFILMKK